MNLSWAEQLDELENDGVEVGNRGNWPNAVIISGPERSTVTSEAGRKDRRLIIPRNPSAFPGFPTDVSKFDTAAAFGEAVLKFWAYWRKKKAKDNLKAKKEAERATKMANKQIVADKNEKLVGADPQRSRSNYRSDRSDRRDS